jgi:glycosyltransferase involved in cell wall biosynthesis/predicted O-methyltransferase YrrM
MSGSNSNSKSFPLVSIVTPSFNQAHFIEKTIRSVIYQDYPNLEYYVLDSLSADGTAEILDKYAGQITRAIREKDDGQADAINKGFKLCSGQIMAYLNSDDCYATPYVVSRAVEYFDQNPGVDVVYGKREYIDEKGFFLQNYPFRSFVKEDLIEACFIPQECVFWRKSIYEKAGNKVDKDFSFAMDYDLWLRFLAAGAEFLSVDEYFGLFRWYPGQKSRDVWIKYGLPEIAKLQEKHLGYALPEDEMIAKYQQHWYGVNRIEHAKTFTQSVRVWNLFASNKKNLLSSIPRDQWVFMNHLESGLKLEPVAVDANNSAIKTHIGSSNGNGTVVASATAAPVKADDFLIFKNAISKSKLFDEKHYLSQLDEQPQDALRHFFENGLHDPHPLFKTSYYLDENPDVKKSGQNALLHWLTLGTSEGRNPHPLFDVKFYLKNNPSIVRLGTNPLQHFWENGLELVRSPHLLFDVEYYIQQYGDELNGKNPLLHYLEDALNHNPHPLFDSDFYRQRYMDKDSKANVPLEHFVRYGAARQLSPHPKLLYESYELAEPGLRGSELNVLEHYLLKGRFRPKYDSVTPVADMVERELNIPVRCDELFKELRNRGIYVMREHYFRPMSDPAKMPESHWLTQSEMPGITIDSDAALRPFENDKSEYIHEFRKLFPVERPSDEYAGFYLLNDMYMAVDAHVYWSMVRSLKPKKIIEIGAGNSTMLAAAALKLNATTGSELVVIEPYPDQIVKAGLTGFARVIGDFVENTDLALFDTLSAGDILFIDSTHVIRQGGDVQHIYLEILPRLKPGIYVHIHDISLPKNYPRPYMEQALFWTEQYLLQAYLAHNNHVEIVWPGNYLMCKEPERMLALFPEIELMRKKHPSSEPSAFWFLTK